MSNEKGKAILQVAVSLGWREIGWQSWHSRHSWHSWQLLASACPNGGVGLIGYIGPGWRHYGIAGRKRLLRWNFTVSPPIWRGQKSSDHVYLHHGLALFALPSERSVSCNTPTTHALACRMTAPVTDESASLPPPHGRLRLRFHNINVSQAMASRERFDTFSICWLAVNRLARL